MGNFSRVAAKRMRCEVMCHHHRRPCLCTVNRRVFCILLLASFVLAAAVNDNKARGDVGVAVEKLFKGGANQRKKEKQSNVKLIPFPIQQNPPSV